MGFVYYNLFFDKEGRYEPSEIFTQHFRFRPNMLVFYSKELNKIRKSEKNLNSFIEVTTSLVWALATYF